MPSRPVGGWRFPQLQHRSEPLHKQRLGVERKPTWLSGGQPLALARAYSKTLLHRVSQKQGPETWEGKWGLLLLTDPMRGLLQASALAIKRERHTKTLSHCSPPPPASKHLFLKHRDQAPRRASEEPLLPKRKPCRVSHAGINVPVTSRVPATGGDLPNFPPSDPLSAGSTIRSELRQRHLVTKRRNCRSPLPAPRPQGPHSVFLC